jgi:hypothetical protein
MQAAQMQQFMRPPPEYKMQQSAPEGYPTNASRQNPLQTMQDMVEQTNSMQASGYGNVKSESPTSHIQNGMMQSAQMAAMQRGTVSSTINSGSIMSQNDPNQAGYHMSHMQRQQSYPGAHMDTSLVRPTRQAGNNYTSTIMRNQRPPNVNVAIGNGSPSLSSIRVTIHNVLILRPGHSVHTAMLWHHNYV